MNGILEKLLAGEITSKEAIQYGMYELTTSAAIPAGPEKPLGREMEDCPDGEEDDCSDFEPEI